MALLSAITKAVDELVQLGYPREVAERIVDGTLDMRPEARAERQRELYPDVFYSGTTSPNITDNEVTKTAPQFLYMSASPGLAASYAGRIKDNFPTYQAPSVYPFAVNTQGMDRVLGEGATWNTMQSPLILPEGDASKAYRVLDPDTDEPFTTTTDDMVDFLYEMGGKGTLFENVQDVGPYYDLLKASIPSKTGTPSQFEIDNYMRELEANPPTNVVVPDTSSVRSLYGAAFDPEYKGSNMLGGTAAGALGLTALMAPEEAEAGILKAFGREFDPRFDPRAKEQEKLRDTTFTIEERGTQDAPRIPLANLEGRPFVTTMSDRTQAGGLLTGIDDVALDRPINLQGGQGFMFENPGMVWASAPGVVNQIMRAASEVGDNPVYLPFRMAPTGGDFATMTGETMLSFASSNMNKTQKKALDKAIRDYESVGSMVQGKRVGAGLKIKGWKGVDDPSSVEVWRNTPDTLRKELMNMMDVQFRDKGGLSIGQARLAVTEPGQADALDAQIQNIGEIFTGKDVVQASGHPSYPAGVPGQGLGRTDQEVNIFELLTDARFGGQQKPVGDPLKPTAQEIRALQMKPYTGRITEDTLKALEARGVEVGSVNPSLLAALAAGSGAGTLAMQDESVADTAARLRAESDTSGAYAPRSGLLQDVTMAARDLERRLEGSPASLLFPSGYIQHLEEFNRPYERSTYTGALLGALDFL